MVSTYNYQNVVSLSSSDEADAGPGDDQPARNNLTNWNSQGEKTTSPQSIFPFQLLMPKKTFCFHRSKKK